MRGFDALAVYLGLAAGDRLSRQCPRLEEAGAPEPFVDAVAIRQGAGPAGSAALVSFLGFLGFGGGALLRVRLVNWQRPSPGTKMALNLSSVPFGRASKAMLQAKSSPKQGPRNFA
jgi:hypothetical protein